MAAPALLAALVGIAAGCALGPDYQRQELQAPPSFRDIPQSEAESLANTPWWELFEDPQLEELIRIAIAENKDLRIAVERIEEARARYGFARSEYWPRADLSATGGRLRSPLIERGSEAVDAEANYYAVSADVSWEIDFFGRVRRTTEAERNVLFSTEEARRSTVLTLVADVARAYFELRDLDARLEISRRTLEARREYLQLARDRFEGGITPEIDYRQAEAEVHRVAAIVSEFERLIAQQENALSVLLGRSPGAIPRGVPLERLEVPAEVPAGLPAELLDRRPDLREAEHLLAASTANIGAAKALLFPRIALTGSYGFASNELDTLFESPSRSWNLLGNLLQPIFNAGANRRRVEVTESQQRQTLYSYERAVLEAFRETDNALVDFHKTGEQQRAQSERVRAERKVLELAELRYRGGVASYLEVLDAQRSLFNAELDEAQTRGNHLTSFVRLYKALGGGWQTEPEVPEEGTSGTAGAAIAAAAAGEAS